MIQILYFIGIIIKSANLQTLDDSISLNSPSCGKRIRDLKPLPYKIVGGNTSTPEDWGWQVAMKYNGQFTCGGSLINSQWVLTAAHCVYGRSIPGFFSFNIGLHDLVKPDKGSLKRKVSKIIIHSDYSEFSLQNDIALMKLDTPVTYSNQILPVCVPQNDIITDNKTSWATGWGTLISGGQISRYLMEVEMPLLSNEKCKEKFPIVNTSVAICSGNSGENKDTCQGDSGGPLVVDLDKKFQLAGITSWGYGCGDGGVYTRTSFYYDWIIEQIRTN